MFYIYSLDLTVSIGQPANTVIFKVKKLLIVLNCKSLKKFEIHCRIVTFQGSCIQGYVLGSRRTLICNAYCHGYGWIRNARTTTSSPKNNCPRSASGVLAQTISRAWCSVLHYVVLQRSLSWNTFLGDIWPLDSCCGVPSDACSHGLFIVTFSLIFRILNYLGLLFIYLRQYTTSHHMKIP